MDIPQKQAANNAILAGSPRQQPPFLVPSPIPTRRLRTKSQSEGIDRNTVYKGVVKMFCRQKGHGFIMEEGASSNDEALFVHISDIEGEYVPKEGDHVSFNKCHIPPKNEKFHAVHVVITHLADGVNHEKWDSPCSSPRT